MTQKQWELVMGTRPSYFNHDDYYASRPVEQVSYDMIRGSLAGAGWPANNAVDATSFLGKLRAKTGLDFDLPTAAQWECACRAGTTTDYNNGTDRTGFDQDANMAVVGRYGFNSGRLSYCYEPSYSQSSAPNEGTATVGSYVPNAWGLYDMHGNVWEWCLDWISWGGLYTATDPKGVSSGSDRVLRGGSWFDYAGLCDSYDQFDFAPSKVNYGVGFRLCRTLQGQGSGSLVDVGGVTLAEASSVSTAVDTTFVDGTTAEGPFSVAYGSVGAAGCRVTANSAEIVNSTVSGTMDWLPTAVGTNRLSYACGNISMESMLQVKGCAITFNANGGKPAFAEVQKGKGLTYGQLPTVTRTGYQFLGWYTMAVGGTQVTATTVVTGDATLYARWTPNTYAIRFDSNGGKVTMADEPMIYDVEKALTTCVFTRTGYTFAGWAMSADGEVQYADGALVGNLSTSGTVTLYAKWTPYSYVVDFNPGQGGIGSMPDQPMIYDEAEVLYQNIFLRRGYTFLGWTDDPNKVNEVLYRDGAVVENLTDEQGGEFELYAIWKANEYTVRFDANGGTGTMADQEFLYDEEKALAVCAFSKTGYAFAGWHVSAPCSKDAAGMVGNGAVVSNLTAVADGVVTLSAVWDATGLVAPSELHVDVEKGERAPYADAAVVYDGYLYDGEAVAGSVQVKIAKGKMNKNGGKFEAKVTATVQLADGSKKLSFKGGIADEKGVVSRMSAAGHELDITVGVNGLGGTFRRAGGSAPYKIDGARNVFSGKSAADKSAAEKAMDSYMATYNVAFDCGTLSVTVGKKGKTKVSGTIDGYKVSATSQLVVGDSAAVVPVVIVKKVNLSFCLWLDAKGEKAEVRGATAGASSPRMIAGNPGPIASGAKFWLDEAAVGKMKEWLKGLYADYLPKGLAVAQDGKKWIVAGGAKAGKLVLDKTTGALDLVKSKITDNTSGLKLTYKEKDGTFKGSFKVYNLENGTKIKSYTANVTGVLIGEKGYGTATIKKVGTVAVSLAEL